LEAAQLRIIFGGELIEIHHIGNISIPEMDAKPIIDVLLVVNDIQKIDTYNEKMQHAGYVPRESMKFPGGDSLSMETSCITLTASMFFKKDVRISPATSISGII
jgi:GrpB-like predicted nucleotidyltransferase (UPF0157 family)